jgi:hypothetical protein
MHTPINQRAPRSRKERRDQEFKGEKLPRAAKLPFPQFADNGLLLIPEIRNLDGVLSYMLEYGNIPDEFKVHVGGLGEEPHGEVVSPMDYVRFIQTWFHKGINLPKFYVKARIVAENKQKHKSPEEALFAFVNAVLNDWAPSQDHKVAYCAFVLSVCCNTITWGVK